MTGIHSVTDIYSSICIPTEDKYYDRKKFFDRIENADRITCYWNKSLRYGTTLEVTVINDFVIDEPGPNYFLILDFDLEILKALEKKGCHWETNRNPSTIEELKHEIDSELSLFDKDSDDSEDSEQEILLRRVMRNLPDIDNYY